MMEESDYRVLNEMRRALTNSSNDDPGNIADRLIQQRDKLTFNDVDWYNDLTQEIVTLDSASTFSPKNDAQNQQLTNAIEGAIAKIVYLIGLKVP